jgi:hypothetical protein
MEQAEGEEDDTFHHRWMWRNEYGLENKAAVRESILQSLAPGQSHLVSMEFHPFTLIHYQRLPALAAEELLQTWKAYPLYDVSFKCLDIGSDVKSLDLWEHFCQTLGAIATLRVVRIGYVEGLLLPVTTAIRNMRQISHLALYRTSHGICGFDDEAALNDPVDLARALNDHPCLNSLEYGLPPVTLPVLQAMPLLRKISLFKMDGCNPQPVEVASEDAKELANFIKGRKLDALRIAILQFTSNATSQDFCAGISESLATYIRLSFVLVQDAMALADALSLAPCLTELEVHGWPLDNAYARLTAFLTTLARRLPTMKLVKLDLEELATKLHDLHDDSDILLAIGATLPLIICAAATCSTLRELRLPHFTGNSNNVDKALANFIASDDSQLQTLVLGCPLQPFSKPARVSYPLLREAMKKSHTLEKVILKLRRHGRFGEIDPWCDDYRKEVEMVARLNMSGRKYLKADPGQRALGFQVLANVNDDSNCLFFHLRENPTLCQRSGPNSESMIYGSSEALSCLFVSFQAPTGTRRRHNQ